MTALATSSGVPMRPTTVLSSLRRSASDPAGLLRRNRAVSIEPGATVFTVIPSLPSSIAIVRAIPITAALVAPYPRRLRMPRAALDDMFTIRPRPQARIAGRNDCVSNIGACRWSATR